MAIFERVRSWQRTLMAGLGLIGGCGPGEAGGAWWDEDAAAIVCAVSGRDRAAPSLQGMPVVPIPSGLYARTFDPFALDDLGYARKFTACAVLRTPGEETIEAMASSMTALAEVHHAQVLPILRAGGRCVCEAASALGARDLVATCLSEPARTNCAPDSARIDAVADALQPVVDAVEAATLPLVHWRLVGRSDRPGWFVQHLPELLGHHPGGSTAYLRGQAVPRRDNHVLIRRLLEEEGVVAVVRQDGGRALLVARELEDMLVFDHFAHPGATGDRRPLLTFLDNANVEQYLDALRPPARTRKPSWSPKEGTVIELDRSALQRVDRVVAAAAPLVGEPVPLLDDDPGIIADRISVQAPFGHEGQVVRMRVALSDAGRQWAQTLSDTLLSPTLDEIRLPATRPLPDAARGLPFVFRAQPVEALLFGGFSHVPTWLRAVEMEHPGTIGGTQSAWEIALPRLDPAPPDASHERWKTAWLGLRASLGQRRYVVKTRFDARRDTLTVVWEPS